MELLVFAGIAAYLYFQKQKKKFVSGYRVTVKDLGFDFKKFTESLFTKLWFPVKLRVENPSDINITIQGVDVTVYSNNQKLGTGRINDSAVVKAKGATDIKFTVGIPVISGVTLVKQIIERIKNGNSVSFDVKGEMDLNVGLVTFAKSFTA